jgi:hypothetical protein
MGVGKIEGVFPDVVSPADTIAGVRDDNAIKKLVLSLKCYIKAAPNQRADDGFHLGISLGNGLIDISLNPKWDKASRSDNFNRSKGAQVAYYLLPLLL